ncbi:DHA2 family efflux MFS transporter permease subunit [Govanella unica]|uniref:DHA2 family efflux MFS transporter permease subunit n=1 Tax=Govanella unica TaxID=2975056 RepID=A0A9X3TZR5_9PROT|nr:DHA2 family efflux MFS transporter permease subunit [Govania unica]MDA5194759.1 DHA2 family efflux MFS transporter permease subunit [Govania unica]
MSSATSVERPHPTRAQYIGWGFMVLGMFMAILDIQIVASSIAQIQAGLAASPDEISWIQTSYLIAEVIMIPLSGYLARMISTRKLFVISAIGFTVMSIACACAWSIESMIVFRALQGFLGGAMIPTVFTTTFSLFPRQRQAFANVIVGLVATMAPTIGPTLGGWLSETLSWHWLFLVNLVPGALIIFVVSAMPALDRADASLRKGFDIIGLTLMALFLGSLEYVLDEGPRDDWFDKPSITFFTVVCVASAFLFFRRVLSYDKPIVNIRAFRDRNFAIGCLYSFIIGIGLYGATYIMPLFLGRVRGYNALQIGTIMAIAGIFQFASAPIAGRLQPLMDPRLMLGIGLALFGGGLFLSHYETSDWSFHEFLLPQAVRGLGLMFCFIPVNALALGTLPPAELNNASGLYNLMRNLGGAIGMAGINTLLDSRLHLHMARLSDRLDPSRPEFRNLLEGLTARLGDASGINADAAAMKIIAGLVQREATVLAFNDVYLVMAGVFVVGILLMPLVRKPAHVVKDGH